MKKTYKKTPLLFLLLTYILISACAPNSIYRYNYTPCIVDEKNFCDDAAISLHNQGNEKEFQLGIIEYDDQGQLRDRKQMESVINHYNPISEKDDVLLTVFIHGWHHSAKPGDTNIESFKGMLQNISKQETLSSAQDERPKRKVLGVYIGWRGDSLTLPIIKQSTFWARKAVAQEVGLQGVSEVLLKLEKIVKIKDRADNKVSNAGEEAVTQLPLNSRMITIGHSFGGAVLYTSLQQILADRYIDSKARDASNGNSNGFGDLVILMNPAFEAMRYSTLFDLSQSCTEEGKPCKNYSQTQLPNLAVLTSEADAATRYAFPIGRFLGNIFETHDVLDRLISTKDNAKAVRINEGIADNKAIGHFKPFWTHTLAPLNKSKSREKGFNFHSLPEKWAKQDYDSNLEFEEVKLTHLGRSHPRNPFLNIYVDGSLIKNHNDIWGVEIQKFLLDLFIISTIPTPEKIKNI